MYCKYCGRKCGEEYCFIDEQPNVLKEFYVIENESENAFCSESCFQGYIETCTPNPTWRNANTGETWGF